MLLAQCSSDFGDVDALIWSFVSFSFSLSLVARRLRAERRSKPLRMPLLNWHVEFFERPMSDDVLPIITMIVDGLRQRMSYW